MNDPNSIVVIGLVSAAIYALAAFNVIFAIESSRTPRGAQAGGWLAYLYKPPVAHLGWQSALPTQNAVQQRHHPRCVRAAGFSGAPGRAGAQATGEPHPLPRRVRPRKWGQFFTF